MIKYSIFCSFLAYSLIKKKRVVYTMYTIYKYIKNIGKAPEYICTDVYLLNPFLNEFTVTH